MTFTLVNVLGQSSTALTDDGGNFQLNFVPSGDYTLGPPPLFSFGQAPLPAIHIVAGTTLDVHDVQITNLSGDASNCGASGISCGAGACVNATCQAPPPTASCNDGVKNGTETDVDCGGSCSTKCAVGRTCAASGDCQVVANATPLCSNGICGVGSCSPSFGNCDGLASNGCETNLAITVSSCGQCGRACSQGSTCVSGACQAPANLCANVVCTALDQCHAAGTCNPATGACSNPVKTNGTACSDGNACTQSDTCLAGICNGGNPVSCQSGTCNPVTGACSGESIAQRQPVAGVSILQALIDARQAAARRE